MKRIVSSLIVFSAFVVSYIFPMQSAAGDVPGKNSVELPSGLTIRVQVPTLLQSFFAKHERRLLVCESKLFGCASLWLVADFGRKVSLYRQDDGTAIVVNSVWMMELMDGPRIRIFDHQEEMDARLREDEWNCMAEGPVATGEPLASMFFKDMNYLGAFQYRPNSDSSPNIFGYDNYQFVSSEVQGEQLCRYPARG